MNGKFDCAFYFAPGKWYIKFGTPDDRNNITYLGFIKYLEAYMEVGNYQVDPMPPIPDEIRTVLLRSGVDPSFFQRGFDPAIQSGAGFIFGADIGFDYKGQFLIFKASVGAKAGFDISLKKYDDQDVNCNGRTSVGADGWYAMGQVYAGVWGSIDISTDFFGDINILDVGAGAALQAGIPNPTWVSGAIGGYYSVLDGLISGSLHFEFTIGEKCVVTTDVLKDFKLISDITPAEGADNSKADVTIEPAVAFNYRMSPTVGNNASFSVLQHTGENIGDTVRRYFRFNQNCVAVNFNDNDHSQQVAYKEFVSPDGTGIAVGPNQTLDKTTN
jgi:hypothetical protein